MKKKKKDNPNYYTYYFVDGTKSTVTAAEVGQKWIDILCEMDEAEHRGNYNYRRHNYPLSQVDYEGETFVDPDADPYVQYLRNIERIKIDTALDTLTEKQRNLFEKYFYLGEKVTEIADEEGVCHQAISRRLDRIKNKLQKILGTDRSETGFSSLYSEGL